MSKKAAQAGKGASPMLFLEAAKRRHNKLFLPRFLKEEAFRAVRDDDPNFQNAKAMLGRWADRADAGHLGQKETSLDAEFLHHVFSDALGYKSVIENPDDFHRQKSFSIPGGQCADGALGWFASGKEHKPLVLIELKGADADLDHDKFNGRTPVQQLFDYLNESPKCPWGIVSNYITLRLYHRDRTTRAYEEFNVRDFRDPERLKEFYFLFHRDNLLGVLGRGSRTQQLLDETINRQRTVGDELYNDYANQRSELIAHLIEEKKRTQDQAIHIAQKLLDRIIFIAFCEDRRLLPEKTLDKTYRNVPPYARATNPIWQNFKDLFGAIDKGLAQASIPPFNGGLFATDPTVDDLDLDDQWTHFFRSVGEYDFQDEVNVDVLGHLFERSVTELEKRRVLGLFGKQTGSDGAPEMPKSAQRKRFGIYYTPPQFTELIVEKTLGELIRLRVEPLADLAARVAALRQLKVCDPACGSGAFLIAAYEKLADAYEDVARLMRIAGDKQADGIISDYPDWILTENLYGVDVSPESVEISQLALWIRSARRGKTLANLSSNIVCRNSLLRDKNVTDRPMNWRVEFAEIFNSPAAGFDAVIGNPPWERMKLQEREFFALGDMAIAAAVNAADRRKLIAKLEADNPDLWKRYEKAKADAEKALACVRGCEDFPLTAKGDINTYMLFAELARRIVSPTGRVGLLVPSGIATDATTAEFFSALMDQQTLIALYDFENREGIFPDVDGRFKFSVLLMGGGKMKTEQADFVFFAHAIEDIADRSRHIALSQKDLKLLNPNTRTCPIFRSEKDAELTKALYRRVPILVDENRKEGGNPWGVRFLRMFDQTNDAERFISAEELKANGFRLDGNHWVNRKQVFLPLYEAKMIQAFDHRAASVVIDAANWMRQGQTEDTSLVDHQNPEFAVMPRYWVDEAVVAERMAVHGGIKAGVLAFKDITSATNQRTMIAAALPRCATINHCVVLLCQRPVDDQLCLLANLNSLAFDYVARQKVGGVTLNFFIVEQLPTLHPSAYLEPCPWNSRIPLKQWMVDRVLKLTCTSKDILPLAQAARSRATLHRWSDRERAELRAELDAAFFHLYGLSREDVLHVLETFQGFRTEAEPLANNEIGRNRIVSAFDQLSR
jgi:hypothetical protein